jgi:hypothetical protein
MGQFTTVHTYDCPEHGSFFVTAGGIDEIRLGGLGPFSITGNDDSDLDSAITARLKPKHPLKSDAIAVPEPDPEPDSE